MSTYPLHEPEAQIIEVEPPRKRHYKRWIILSALVVLFLLSRLLSIYVESLWFGSLGYVSVLWYMLKLKVFVFLIFAVLTFIILRLAFALLARAFPPATFARRFITVNNQRVAVQPSRILGPVAWIAAILFALLSGLEMKSSWRAFALYLNQPQTSASDPIFHKPLGFYLFSLPIYQEVSGWLTTLAFIILIASVIYALLSLAPDAKPTSSTEKKSGTGYAVVSVALAIFLLTLAWRVFLSRFPYLWQEHQTFTGVTYMEANYLLPGLVIVAITLIVAALLALVNAFTQKRLGLLIVAIALPIAVYIIACALIPAYVTSFIVKPNELGRETLYIEQNLNWTRRAFGLDRIQMRDFDVQATTASLKLDENRATFDNVRLWDWNALLDTLRQIQEIRTYYDFKDVDVDRYRVGGSVKQMMLAARELNPDKLPSSSRNWVNERLIYTHGYGVTMNPVNGFTPEGMPLFVLSNMPSESSAPEIKVTRPEIYFGEETESDVYVKTREQEFNYPQGESNNYTTYEGTGGIAIGGSLRRLMLAWALDDLSKLPFADQVTPDSRVLMRRNIIKRVNALAPFLIYDSDPYIVVSDDGRLFWMLDAFTESANYPYSRHHSAAGHNINYIRNSVKVVIDAYNGTTDFYVFDAQDPLINAYRSVFPALFKDSSAMPADLRAHIRYPETLINVQGAAFGLYHTQNSKVFFQREDVWSVASQISLSSDKQQKAEPLEPYFVLMQLPGEAEQNEFVQILPFTPASRNNMIGWMAGRSDGEHYGKLLVYDFPKSKLIDGPLQIEARIDQNAQLSSLISLWNQQGSHVRRGNLLVIPIGQSLLYVEPIYLQAVNSPMPELRLVVLATQDQLAYGASFEEAMTKLFGDSAKQLAQNRPEQNRPQSAQNAQAATTPTTSALPRNTQDLINRASQEFNDYQRLTAEGKLAEAGQKLEALKKTLEELKKAGGQ